MNVYKAWLVFVLVCIYPAVKFNAQNYHCWDMQNLQQEGEL